MANLERRERKRRQTADRIAAAAFALFEAHGYDAVTMESIAAQADVARATLYNHFPVKEAVLVHGLHAQLGRDLGTLMEAVLARDGFMSRMAMLLEASAGWWEAHRQYAAPYVRHRFQHVDDGNRRLPSSEMLDAYAALIARAREDGELDAGPDAMQLAHYMHALYLASLLLWIADPGLRLADELADALDFFARGAGLRKAAQAGRA